MDVRAFHDSDTRTMTYVVYKNRDAVVIDPVLDFDPAAVKVSTRSVDAVIAFLHEDSLTLRYVLETHAHADHMSAAQHLRRAFPDCQIAIGSGIVQVQNYFKKAFNLLEFHSDGSQFQRLLSAGDRLSAGELRISVIPTPGHTPACVSYLIGGHLLFTGDAIFMPDSGTGRCDFPGGSAVALYRSITNLYALPDETQVYVGHDYQPGGRELRFHTTIGEQKRSNIHMTEKTTEAEFIAFRTKRDAELSAPRLMLPSLLVNIAAGALPRPEENGVSYLKLPIST